MTTMQVLRLGKTVEDAYAPFFGLKPPLVPYRDASFGICSYHLEVLDCVRAVARAASLRHFTLDTFRPDEYAFYDKIENGDLNWIVPGKFLAFSGPLARCGCDVFINIVTDNSFPRRYDVFYQDQ